MPRKLINDVPLGFATGVRFDNHDRQQLELLARERRVSRNTLIREAVRQFLSQPQKITEEKAG